MTDQIRQKVDTFLNFMKLPDGIPIVPLGMVDWLVANGFFHAPASTKYHGNHEGGLLKHSYMVAKALIGMSEREGLAWSNPRSPWVVGMFHDLCKIDQYRHPVIGETFGGEVFFDHGSWEYNPDTLLKGHGDKSVMLHVHFGFGKKRLKKAWKLFYAENKKLRDYYLMEVEDGGWLCRQKLLQIGVDVEEWYREEQEENHEP